MPSLHEFDSDVEFFKTTMVYEIRNWLRESYFHPTSLGSLASLFREKYKKLRYLSDEQRELTWSRIANLAALIDEEARKLAQTNQQSVKVDEERTVSEPRHTFSMDDLIDGSDKNQSGKQ